MTEDQTPRPRDLIWDQMEVLFGNVVSGTNAHHKRNKAVKDLKLMGAEPDELHRALASFNASFPSARCTDIALATHFPMLRPRKVAAACPECGLGGGYHLLDCLTQRHSNVRRAG